mmetsp:Transcript_36483/g.54423  ORF Transcript_36483/g.54423 Transcript_36483/m.54423 type:complete len:242 (-) Transcript_36483:41-766(-)|eukprot:CAMPEP_0194028484 /NCGR_PEP_ID=MMETSP0009_2-20130614/2428_1 /TAXON_ID=210454 /ORGANISM="Grammatophora oceanica, Strain CCMP 410" /LENGTH=241 /DNA_ID=CAMNT_0038667883 /DNA_START=140 /DNA_END=865 /DNA_ORIENTATION=-
MSRAGRGGTISKDLYRVLKVKKTATTAEIKQAYRKLALAFHPDRHDGDESKTSNFKEASEAYKTLSDHSSRTAYDRIINNVHGQAAKKRQPPKRKVYRPRPPPGMKIFDEKKWYDMHYGDGQMQEELEYARRRAKEAGNRQEYVSPLGKGFKFESPDDRNPYSRAAQGPSAGKKEDFIFEYEEAHFYDMDGGGLGGSGKRVVQRRTDVRDNLKQRRAERIRNREARDSRSGPEIETGCVIS